MRDARHKQADHGAPAGDTCSCDGLAAERGQRTREAARSRGAVAASVAERIVWLRGGRFLIGTDAGLLPQDGEGPARLVAVKEFGIDPMAVTNDWFSAFVGETGFQTDAERWGWSLVFEE